MNASRIIASIPKRGTEEIRVSIAEHEGYTFIDMRVFAPTSRSRGEPRPTKAGICIVRNKLPALIKALQAADGEASR